MDLDARVAPSAQEQPRLLLIADNVSLGRALVFGGGRRSGVES
jgi:hypothetical protein